MAAALLATHYPLLTFSEWNVFVGNFGATAASSRLVVVAAGVEVVAAARRASAHSACTGTGCGAIGAST